MDDIPVYTANPENRLIHFGKITFSELEIKDLIKSWLAISLSFAFILTGGIENFKWSGFVTVIIISSITVGIGFIFHELGHKVLAQKYGAWAEFRAWNSMLILGLVLSIFIGFALIAPGAVFIAGRTIGKNRNGKISAMGPMMNFIMALIFLPIAIIYSANSVLGLIGSYGFAINAWLGTFNMIPFAMFDGKKIFDWSKVMYFILVAIGISLLVMQYAFLKTIF